MSKNPPDVDQTLLIRAVFLAALRSGRKQCFGSFMDGRGGVCAMRLFYEARRNFSRLSVSDGIVLGVNLIGLNDVYRMTFPQIADYLEANWNAQA